MFLLYRFFAFLTLRLPARPARGLFSFAAGLRYLATPVFRRRIRENYRVVLERSAPGGPRLEWLVWRAYLNFGRYLYEFLAIPRLTAENVREMVEIRGEAHLAAAFARKKGVLSLTAHLGNWELAGVVTGLLGYPVTAVALEHRDRRLNRLFMGRRRMGGVRIVPLGRGLRKVLSALKRNELVALLGDRVFTPPTVRVDFFGRPTRLPAGPAILAVKTGAAVVPGFLCRENKRLVLEFEPPLAVEASLPEAEAVLRLVRGYAACLEERIRRFPGQWLVFDYLWKP